MDYDAETGVSTFHDYLPETDTTIIETVQSAEAIQAILDNNARLRNDPSFKQKGFKKGWVRAACVPVGVQVKWKKDFGVWMMDGVHDRDEARKCARLIEDPDYKYLKTVDGKVLGATGRHR